MPKISFLNQSYWIWIAILLRGADFWARNCVNSASGRVKQRMCNLRNSLHNSVDSRLSHSPHSQCESCVSHNKDPKTCSPQYGRSFSQSLFIPYCVCLWMTRLTWLTWLISVSNPPLPLKMYDSCVAPLLSLCLAWKLKWQKIIHVVCNYSCWGDVSPIYPLHASFFPFSQQSQMVRFGRKKEYQSNRRARLGANDLPPLSSVHPIGRSINLEGNQAAKSGITHATPRHGIIHLGRPILPKKKHPFQ